MADALHTRSDVLTSCAVLVSLASVRLGYPLLDPIGALLVAVFIARTGLEIARETSPILADRVVLDEDGIRTRRDERAGRGRLPPDPVTRLARPRVPRSARLVPRQHAARTKPTGSRTS